MSAHHAAGGSAFTSYGTLVDAGLAISCPKLRRAAMSVCFTATGRFNFTTPLLPTISKAERSAAPKLQMNEAMRSPGNLNTAAVLAGTSLNLASSPFAFHAMTSSGSALKR